MQLKKSKMNKKTLFSFLTIALFTAFSFAQNRALPNKDVKTLDGSNFNITNLENDGNPIVISFCSSRLDMDCDRCSIWHEGCIGTRRTPWHYDVPRYVPRTTDTGRDRLMDKAIRRGGFEGVLDGTVDRNPHNAWLWNLERRPSRRNIVLNMECPSRRVVLVYPYC